MTDATYETTRTDSRPGAAWLIDDRVTQLREWGTSRVHALPLAPVQEWVLGASASCNLRLEDRKHWTSRRHARLVWSSSSWTVHDLGSKNGLWVDGERRPCSALAPGVELGIGSLRLVAESPRLAAVRGLLARWIGWSEGRARDVDRALWALRELAAARAPVVIRGVGDLVPLARQLHARAFGTAVPFVVNDPHRAAAAATTTGPRNEPDIAEAVRAAAGGTLCLRAERSAMSLAEAFRRIDRTEGALRVILCAQSSSPVGHVGASITTTPLDVRGQETPRIVEAYAADAAAQLGVPYTATEQDVAAVLHRKPTSYAELETAALRVIAVRAFGGVTRAAPHLGISHVALSRWMSRRR